MLDFGKGKFHKYRLSEVDYSEFIDEVAPLLIDSETIIGAFKAGRDGVLFTTKRLITIDKQNIKKTDFTSIPYSSIDVFSVETAGFLDRDAELDICVKGSGKFCFEFDRASSMPTICQNISIGKFGDAESLFLSSNARNHGASVKSHSSKHTYSESLSAQQDIIQSSQTTSEDDANLDMSAFG